MRRNVNTEIAPSDRWYYSADGERSGPVTEGQLVRLLRSGQLDIDSLVWTKPMPGWLPAEEVFDISTLRANGSAGQQTPAAPPAHSMPPIGTVAPAQNEDKKLIFWGWFGAFTFPIVGAILGVWAIVKGKIGHGIGQIVVSYLMYHFWVAFWPSFFAASNS